MSSTCQHCGTTFQATKDNEHFCCSGCQYVYRLIHDDELSRYYELKDQTTSPVGASVFSEADYNWLKPLAATAEANTQSETKLTLGLHGISCVGCIWLIDKVFHQQDGATACRINPQQASVTLSWIPKQFDIAAFARRIHAFGYELSPDPQTGKPETSRIAWRLGLTGAFALNSMLYTLPSYLGMDSDFALAPHFGWLSALFATLSMLVGGSYFIAKAAKALTRKIVHLDLPISLGLIAAYSISWYGFFLKNETLLYFDFVCTFVFLMMVGRWLQAFALERNRQKLSRLSIKPPEVLLTETGETLSAKHLKPGDRYTLNPDTRNPVDSELLSEQACIATDWINGESDLSIRERGTEILSGSSHQGQSPIQLRALQSWDESLLNKLSHFEVDSQERDQALQRWISYYLFAALAVALLGGAAWLFFGDTALSRRSGAETDALRVFISILVVSCPCAIGIALPLADEIALSRLKLKGVFARTHTLWNRLNQVRQIVFDKTGTLTRSNLHLRNPEILNTLEPDALQAVSQLVRQSKHPVSRSIRERLMATGLYDRQAQGNVQETVGQGLETQFNYDHYRLGRATWSQQSGHRKQETVHSLALSQNPEPNITCRPERRTGNQSHSSSSIAEPPPTLNIPTNFTILTRNGTPVAYFDFVDAPRNDAYQELSSLKDSDLDLYILSGDHADKVATIANTLGIPQENAHGELLPEDKAEWLRAHKPDTTLMIGDGANDSLAFDVAHCSGTPANEQSFLAEKADFYYLGDGIQGIRWLLQVSDTRRKAIARVLAFAIAYNLFAVALSLAALMTPLLAAILMPVSSLVSIAIAWFSQRR